MKKNIRNFLCMFLFAFLTSLLIPSVSSAAQVQPGIRIYSEPADTTVSSNTTFYFTVYATTPGYIKYQWQYSSNGKTWYDSTLSASKSSHFHCVAKPAYNGRLYRCKVSNLYGESTYTRAARLTVTDELAFLRQPEDVSQKVGQYFYLNVSCTGLNLTYQWQYSKDNGATWLDSKINSAYRSGYYCITHPEYANRLYRCIVTDINGKQIISNPVRLTLRRDIQILSQPEDTVIEPGKYFTFSIDATGDGLTYQWIYEPNPANGYASSYHYSTLSSATTSTLRCKAVESYHDRIYRCKVTDMYGDTVYSAPARLTVSSAPGPSVIDEPEDIVVTAGKTFSLHVEAKGTGLTYQWQYVNYDEYRDSSYYSSYYPSYYWIDSSHSTASKPTFSCKADIKYNKRMYRCVITDAEGYKTYTRYIRLTVIDNFGITGQPEDVVITSGKNFSFTVNAVGTGLTYRWQYSKDGIKWTDSSLECRTSSTFTCKAAASYNGRLYRCIISNYAGAQQISRSASLTVTAS